MMYEVVCTQNYLDVGLLLYERNGVARRVKARSSEYSKGSEYGGVEKLVWLRTGVFLTEKEWDKITYCKPTDDILKELHIKKNKKISNVDKLLPEKKQIEKMDRSRANKISNIVNRMERCEEFLNALKGKSHNNSFSIYYKGYMACELEEDMLNMMIETYEKELTQLERELENS